MCSSIMGYDWQQEPNRSGKKARGGCGKASNLKSHIHQLLFTTCEEVGIFFNLDFMEKVSSKCLNPPGAAGTPQMFSENRTAVPCTMEPSSCFP